MSDFSPQKWYPLGPTEKDVIVAKIHGPKYVEHWQPFEWVTGQKKLW